MLTCIRKASYGFRQLHIKIDKKKTANEVANIVESDYFQQLERKVDELRLSLKTP
jgi:hypothetical protein